MGFHVRFEFLEPGGQVTESEFGVAEHQGRFHGILFGHPFISHPFQVVAAALQENIIFDVADNGVGMNKETLENLFDLFFSSKGHRGTGIGLFLAYQVVTFRANHFNCQHFTSRSLFG